MAWIKSTSNYVADWRVFTLTGRSMGQLAVFGLLLGILWGFGVVKLYGLPGDPTRATMAKDASWLKEWVDAGGTPAAPKGECSSDYKTWEKMPEGQQKASKLVYFKKAYGRQNFHPNCTGSPRHVSAAEAIQ